MSWGEWLWIAERICWEAFVQEAIKPSSSLPSPVLALTERSVCFLVPASCTFLRACLSWCSSVLTLKGEPVGLFEVIPFGIGFLVMTTKHNKEEQGQGQGQGKNGGDENDERRERER